MLLSLQKFLKGLKLNICLCVVLCTADAHEPCACRDFLYCNGYNWILRDWSSTGISKGNCWIEGDKTKLLSSGMQAVSRFARIFFQQVFRMYFFADEFQAELEKLWNRTQKMSLPFFFSQVLFTDAFLILLPEWENTLYQRVVSLKKL